MMTDANELDRIYKEARRHFAAGEMERSESLCRRALERAPDYRAVLNLMGMIRESQREFQKAVEFYEASMNSVPGHAFAATRRGIILSRPFLGNPPQPRVLGAGQAFVSMRNLGSNGRFGNALLQYFVLREYAKRAGAVALAPDWVGRDLYGLDDPLPGINRAEATLREEEVLPPLCAPEGTPRANVDLHGIFRPYFNSMARAEGFRETFKPVPKVQAVAAMVMNALHSKGRTVVAMHLRRGDSDGWPPTACYRRWLDSLWNSLDRPVLYIASDDPGVLADFSGYSPMSAADLPITIPGIEFYVDHLVLSRASCMAVSSSTFSWTASLLNGEASVRARPDKSSGVLVPWNGFGPP